MTVLGRENPLAMPRVCVFILVVSCLFFLQNLVELILGSIIGLFLPVNHYISLSCHSVLARASL